MVSQNLGPKLSDQFSDRKRGKVQMSEAVFDSRPLLAFGFEKLVSLGQSILFKY